MTEAPLWPALGARAASLPAGPKLLALMALGTALLLIRSPWLLGAAVVAGLGLSLLAVGRRRTAAAASTGLVLAIGCVALFTLLLEGMEASLAVLLRLVALVLFAHLLTETTRASAVQDALVAALRPFERLPFVSAERTGLAFAIALRSLPRVGAALRELSDARAARGLSVSAHLLVVPLVARILRDARETADAIDARSWSGARGTDP